MKYLALLFLVACASVNKDECSRYVTIRSIQCSSSTCRLLFSDGTDFYLPSAVAKDLNIGDKICDK